MNARTDQQLLRAYAEHRSEAEFAELVRRHIDLVYSAAVRMVNDPHLAKDVSQGVFVALARDAGKLADHPVLSGWLHRTARNVAAQTVRTDVRRRNREQQAAAMNEPPETDAEWEEISPHLDAALADLSEPDRDAVLLRYFENKPAREMAAILGISAEAAQKRVSRAVERLRENFAKRGITTGAAGLAGVISANAVQAAPAGLAATISATALTGTATAIVAATKTLAMTTTGKAFVTAAITLIAGAGIYWANDAFSQKKPAGTLPQQPAQVHRDARSNEEGSLTESLARARTGKPPVDRKKQLAKLKMRWLETKSSNDRANLDKQIALSKESVETLLCSEELIELIGFLDEHKFYNTVGGLVGGLFTSPRAAEARGLLIGLPEAAKDGKPYREEWCNAAGRTCPEEEFEAFRAALNCKSCAQEALYGRNVILMGTDPEAAFLSSLEAFESKVPSLSGRYGVMNLFSVELPPNVNFVSLEERLPVISHWSANGEPFARDPLEEIRSKLMWKWAETDPAGAANHVMAHPDRLDAKIIESIVGGYSYKDPTGLVKWVAQFPEGQYYDVAAKAAVLYVRDYHPVEVLESLARKIGDAKTREETLEFLHDPRRAHAR